MSASIVGARCEHSASPPRGVGEKTLYTSDLDWRFDSTLQSARNSGAGSGRAPRSASLLTEKVFQRGDV